MKNYFWENTKPYSWAVALLVSIFSQSTIASIVGTTGSIVELTTVPSSVVEGVVESDTQVNAFDEQTNVTLTSSLSNVYLGGASTNLGTIASGQVLNSTYVFFDPASTTSTIISAAGTISFTTQILGVIWQSATLNNTDSLLGVGTTTYPSSDPNRGAGGFGASPQTDIFQFTPGGSTLNLTQFQTGTGNYDSIRVLTAIPIPAALPLLLSGLLTLGLGARWRRASSGRARA